MRGKHIELYFCDQDNNITQKQSLKKDNADGLIWPTTVKNKSHLFILHAVFISFKLSIIKQHVWLAFVVLCVIFNPPRVCF